MSSPKSSGKRPKMEKPDNKEQSKLFEQMAREIGADEENTRGDALIGKLARTKPEKEKKPSK